MACLSITKSVCSVSHWFVPVLLEDQDKVLLVIQSILLAEISTRTIPSFVIKIQPGCREKYGRRFT